MTNIVDWTKPIQTRSGLKARVLATDLAATGPMAEFSVAVAASDDILGEYLYRVRADGMCTPGVRPNYRDYDIVNLVEKVTKCVWLLADMDGRSWVFTSDSWNVGPILASDHVILARAAITEGDGMTRNRIGGAGSRG